MTGSPRFSPFCPPFCRSSLGVRTTRKKEQRVVDKWHQQDPDAPPKSHPTPPSPPRGGGKQASKKTTETNEGKATGGTQRRKRSKTKKKKRHRSPKSPGRLAFSFGLAVVADPPPVTVTVTTYTRHRTSAHISVFCSPERNLAISERNGTDARALATTTNNNQQPTPQQRKHARAQWLLVPDPLVQPHVHNPGRSPLQEIRSVGRAPFLSSDFGGAERPVVRAGEMMPMPMSRSGGRFQPTRRAAGWGRRGGHDRSVKSRTGLGTLGCQGRPCAAACAPLPRPRPNSSRPNDAAERVDGWADY